MKLGIAHQPLDSTRELSPEWLAFFRECRRLVALARARRAAAKEQEEETQPVREPAQETEE